MVPSKANRVSDDVEQLDEHSSSKWDPGFGHESRSVIPSQDLRSQIKRFWRILSVKRKPTDYSYEYHVAPTMELSEGASNAAAFRKPPVRQQSRVPKLLMRALWLAPILVLASFGILHIVIVILGRKAVANVGNYAAWTAGDNHGSNLDSSPADITRDVHPIPCHSHNDYWRRRPLFDAISWGCISIEADVWHLDGKKELFVGHSSGSLTSKRTLRSLYVDPLVEMLDARNPTTNLDPGNAVQPGIFDEDSNQTLILLIDFKTDGHALFPLVQKQLEPLREKDYLSYWEGDTFVSRAVTVVGTGNTPFDLVIQNTERRDIFFDAPLDEMWEPIKVHDDRDLVHIDRRGGQGKTGMGSVDPKTAFNASNSYYASVSLREGVGLPWTGRLTTHQLDRLRGQIRGAKRRGLKSRYWDTPSWPTSLRNHIWQILIEEGADILNVDDLRAAASLDWTRPVKYDWFDG